MPDIMPTKVPWDRYEIDNRDTCTTELHFQMTVEVEPWDLVCNVIDNAPLDDKTRADIQAQLADLRTKFDMEVNKFMDS